MTGLLQQGLRHPNGFVRKGSTFFMQVPKLLAQRRTHGEEFRSRPPVLANSFPKSGTHLLDQIVEALPERRDFGTFLSSFTSSYRYRRRDQTSTLRILGGIVPGEIMRAHMFYSPAASELLTERNVAHYFIYRDPRDVVLSEAHYYRTLNPWHRLHPYFRDAASIDDAVTMAIAGLNDRAPALQYVDVASRFAEYEGWLHDANVCCVRFEQLTSPEKDATLRRMAEFYAAKAPTLDIDKTVERMRSNINPEKSHTFRSGKSAGWKDHFTDEHRRLFKSIAGSLLVRLGYEQDASW